MKLKRIAAAAAAISCAASMTAIGAFADDNVAGVAGAAGEAAPVATAATTTTAATEETTTAETTTAAPETEAPAEEETTVPEEEVVEEEIADDAEALEEDLLDASDDVDADDPFAALTFQDLLTVQDPSELGLSEDEFSTLAIRKLCEEYGVYMGSGTSSNWGQAVKLLTYNNSEDEPGDDYFDSDLLNEDSVVIVFYEAETAPEFILQSWSGGEGWAKVPADETEAEPGIAIFTYEYMTAMYQSDDFSTVDAIYIGDTGSDLTVYGAYLVNADSLLNAFGLSMDDLEFDVDAEDFDLDADFDFEDEDEEEEEEEETPAEAEAPVEVVVAAPSADGDVPSANTGNMSAAAIAGIMAAAGAAAFAVRKRK